MIENQIKQAIAVGKPSILIHCWDEDWIGAEKMDELISELAISEGKSISWESVGTANTGQKNILVSLGK